MGIARGLFILLGNGYMLKGIEINLYVSRFVKKKDQAKHELFFGKERLEKLTERNQQAGERCGFPNLTTAMTTLFIIKAQRGKLDVQHLCLSFVVKNNFQFVISIYAIPYLLRLFIPSNEFKPFSVLLFTLSFSLP